MASTQIRIVCFDLGGVLVRTCHSWSEGCSAAGLPVRVHSAGDAANRRRRDLIRLFGTGQITEAEWLERLSIALESAYTIDELRRIHHVWSGPEYADSGALIDELNARGVRTACLSNTN